ncbi:hypothetical protein GUJ93_ZPchr0008g12738 [Zizania palustris]|uniref:PHD-type domain-containing protein n=1 Tax=Zizania palustris TaxID=103762 RepID=A0A8J5UW72_ZIZPA|nr:hypothetical protein GUJ93_ZPchr0008g12738 [Zizania palustris]
MEIAWNAVPSGGMRDLPPSKRFKYVGSDLGLVPSLPAKKRVWPTLPETVAVPVCLPAKKRAYAPLAAEEVDLSICLPAKNAYAPSVDADAAACLPAKKRVHASSPPDARASPCVPLKKRVHAPLPLPPANAAVSPSIPIPAKKRVHSSPPPDTYVSPSVPPPLKKLVDALPTPGNVVISPSIPAKKSDRAPPLKKRVDALPTPGNVVVSPSIPAKKSDRAPPSPEVLAASVSVCLPTNKRVMMPFLPLSPLPSKVSDVARVAAVKEAKPQGSNRRSAITNPRLANGEGDYARAEASKVPEKPINPKELKRQVFTKDQECNKSCKVVSAKQPDDQVEVFTKSRKAFDRNEGAREEVVPVPKQEAVAAAEEEEDDGVLCGVCGSTDGDPSDPIVFCDGCDLMVHASCYGNPLAQSIPDDDWFCSVCSVKPKKGQPAARPGCCLCPAKGGAMKRTTDGQWAHITCALLVPEVYFLHPDGRDGVDCSRVPAHRFTKECYICDSSRGCALECSQPKCGLGFHVSCGLDGGLCIEYQEAKAGAVVAGFCLEHTRLWEKQQLTGKYKIVSREQK